MPDNVINPDVQKQRLEGKNGGRFIFDRMQS
jgi:hypothetical protein